MKRLHRAAFLAVSQRSYRNGRVVATLTLQCVANIYQVKNSEPLVTRPLPNQLTVDWRCDQTTSQGNPFVGL